MKRKNSQGLSPNALWQKLNDPSAPLVEQVWPEEKKLGFLDALREMDDRAHDRMVTTFRIAREFNEVPILAVAGPINGGKSSLVGSFLSAAGRARVPIGLGSRQGTQRFVLWIPRAWRDNAAVFDRLHEFLGLVFEQPPECLAADPATAREQYADVSRFSSPLFAVDDHLDRHGIALLDCPDMQRLQENEREGENLRMQAIARAAEICAGVVVVTPRSQLEIRDLADLVRQRIPEAVRIYAVNLMRPPEPPENVHEELRRALNTNEAILCYGAYDFLVPSGFGYSPAWDGNRDRPEGERIPCFFRIDPAAGANRPEQIGPERSILRLADQVRPAVMGQKRQRELIGDLIGQARRNLAALTSRAETDRARLRRAAEELYAAAHDLMHDRDGRLRLKMDPEIVLSFKESMERTAPLHLKPVMALRRRVVERAAEVVRQGREAIARAVPWIRAHGRYRVLQKRLRKQLIQVADIEKLLYRWAVATREAPPDRSWNEEARGILERYRSEERTNMSRDEWDAIARRIWRNTSKLKATVHIFGSFFVGLAAVILIPFDGGASVLGITALELLGVLGFSGLLAAGTLRMLDRELNEKVGYRQFSNFVTLAADHIGLPRSVVEELLREKGLFNPSVKSHLPQRCFGISDAGWRLYRIDPAAAKELGRYLERWEKENHALEIA